MTDETSSAGAIDIARILELLRCWQKAAEVYWYPLPDVPGLGCYGTGYNSWGVQTNQKYVAAMAVLAELGGPLGGVPDDVCAQARERALAALRFSLRSHVSGDLTCTDGTPWGHTWISSLGLERMMYGIYLLEPHLTDTDRELLRRVLTSEAEWIHDAHTRGDQRGIVANPWNSSGQNVPESNLWNGAMLWRAAMMYPDHPHARDWRERAHAYLINSISVADDALSDEVIAGRPVREWYVGPNFFPNYALDHHGYLNVGYMVICLSNAAILHFDMKARGLVAPASLYHHNADLWQVVRRMVFADGRLARIGGDSRVRYAYCQEYLLPTLAYAADYLGERYAACLLAGQLHTIAAEAAYSGDGSFYGHRLSYLRESSPYYYTRLESDRACALGMAICYWQQVMQSQTAERQAPLTAGAEFERSVAGGWVEPEHGAVLHRSSTRLASFAWRAHGLAQGMCQPPDDGDLAEWATNLGGDIRFQGDDGVIRGGQTAHRQLVAQRIHSFDGGFITLGEILEGVNTEIPEGTRLPACASQQIVLAALPDAHTVIGLQYCRTLALRTYVEVVKGLHLNVPNDLFNGFSRRFVSATGMRELTSPPAAGEVWHLDSRWANIDNRVGVVGLYGADQLVVDRAPQRRGGKFQSLYVEEVCFRHHVGNLALPPDSLLLDVGWAVLASATAEETERFARQAHLLPTHCIAVATRGVRVMGMNGRWYAVLANLSRTQQACAAADLLGEGATATDLVSGARLRSGETICLEPESARVFVLE